MPIEWKRFSVILPKKPVLVQGNSMNMDVEIAGCEVPGRGFIADMFKPGKIRARVEYDGRLRYGWIEWNPEEKMHVFVAGPLDR
ncbi:MAG: hypothetical protein PHD72_03250 [Patescibacteria group bacterium]|nr:hypothetical protein [Patescibacteria group bacterium]